MTWKTREWEQTKQVLGENKSQKLCRGVQSMELSQGKTFLFVSNVLHLSRQTYISGIKQ